MLLRLRNLLPLTLLLLLPASAAPAQSIPPRPETTSRTSDDGFDKCGPVDRKRSAELLRTLGPGWGYGYDQLGVDLDRWRESPYVQIRSIGTTVQGRDIWELTVTSDVPPSTPRRRVTVHARTHPQETQSTWVCREMIDYLLSDEPYARLLRDRCTFHLIPMYNPDGVELGNTRENANGVDLEREWDKPNPQPEAAALKRRFSELMASDAPIEIALNLHSSSDTGRYFWYHDPTGTSEEFARLEQRYIGDVRDWFGWINHWSYRVSWIGSTPTHFPESWFWLNYGTSVMALTYEDIYSHSLSSPNAWFDSTALALLRGIGDYLNLIPSAVRTDDRPNSLTLLAVDTHGATELRYSVPTTGQTELSLYDVLGSKRAVLVDDDLDAGGHTAWVGRSLPSGVYFARLIHDGKAVTTRVVVE